MKKLVYSIGAIGFLVSCGGAAEEPTTSEPKDTTKEDVIVVEEDPAPENSFVLDAGALGVFKIGQPLKMPVELSNRKATVSRSIDGAPEDHLQYIIFNSLEDVAEITMEKNDNIHEDDLVIIDMRALTSYYETTHDITVGSSVTELVEKYPDVTFRYNGATGEIMGETVALDGVQFVIDPAACTKKLSGTKDITLTVKNFSEEAKIKYINVF